MEEKKVEHVTSGTPNDFSAIKGKGNAGHAPTTPNYAEKPAIVKWPPKKEGK